MLVTQRRKGGEKMYYLTALFGLIAVTAPFFFGYTTEFAAFWTSLAIGTILIVDSAMEGFSGDKEHWEYWVAGIVGLLAIIAPFALGFASLYEAVLTMTVVGVATIIAVGLKLTLDRTKLRY